MYSIMHDLVSPVPDNGDMLRLDLNLMTDILMNNYMYYSIDKRQPWWLILRKDKQTDRDGDIDGKWFTVMQYISVLIRVSNSSIGNSDILISTDV